MGKCRLFVACSMIGHLYFSGTWFDVAPRTNTKKTCVGNIVRYVGLCVGNMITIVGSIASQQNGGGDQLTILTSTRILSLIKNKLHMSSMRFTRKVATASIWIY